MTTTRARAVLVFDGDCAFCTTCANFLERRIRPAADVVAWQHLDYAALGLTREQCEEAVQWVDGDTRAAGPDAIGRTLVAARQPWRLAGHALLLRPVSWLAWPIYRLIARHRDKMPGGTPACAVPRR